jgi:general secretion pathway protein G
MKTKRNDHMTIGGITEKGFTLVELLIVVIILAILAAIVVPQFSATTTDAQSSALRSNLASIRGAIDLYSQQHTGDFPAAKTSVSACATGTAGTGALNTQAALEEQLTFYSNAAGQTCSIADDPAGGVVEYPFGPYIKGDLPVNPVTNIGTVTIVTTGDLAMPAAIASGGWRYDTTSGKFIADDTVGTDSNGVVYGTY